MRAVLIGPLWNCSYHVTTDEGTSAAGLTDQDGAFEFTIAATGVSRIDASVGGNAGCIDAFTGQTDEVRLYSRQLEGNFEGETMLLTPVSTMSVLWDDKDESGNITATDEKAAAYCGLEGLSPSQFDHIERLNDESTQSLARRTLVTMTKINTMVTVGAAYINVTTNETFGNASQFMYVLLSTLPLLSRFSVI